MILWVVRSVFLMVALGVGASLALLWQQAVNPWLTFGLVTLAALLVMGLDLLFKKKKIATMSAIYFGLVVGFILSDLLLRGLEPAAAAVDFRLFGHSPDQPAPGPADIGLRLVVTALVCYLCISFLLQTKDDFRFIIPYVEFAKEVKGARPFVLDTSVIIDGRIADLAESPMFDNPLVVPGFVLQELQMVADSSDKLKRNRGRRGLDVLNRLRGAQDIELHTDDTELPEFQLVRSVDQRLVLLSKHLNGKLVTNDFNLNKLARAQGVQVVNLNDVANAMRPVVLPGEHMSVRLTKSGEQPGQGVGYLDDGTMVVAEQGKNFIGDEVELLVTSVLQTSAGRMIFGRIDSQPPEKEGLPD